MTNNNSDYGNMLSKNYTYFNITTLSCSTCGILLQLTRLRIAAVVSTVLWKTTVALLPIFQKSVATDGTFKKRTGFVPQAVVHTMCEGVF